jgi:hypothetical protein
LTPLRVRRLDRVRLHADLATTSIYARYRPAEGEADRIERAVTAA